MNPSDPVIENVNKSTEAYIVKNDLVYVVLYFLLTGLIIAWMFYDKLDPRILMLPIMAGFFGYSRIQKKVKEQFTQQFGASIGFTYAPSADLASVNARLFTLGHDQNMYDVLSGVRNGRNARIFSYTFTVGYGKSAHGYSYTVFETTFSNMMPDIVLVPNAGMLASDLSLFNTSEHVELEGDFNKYFTLHVSKGYEIEAYQIFTPDVMAQLIDRARGCSFEFNANKLYIYTSGIVLEREKLQAMFDLAEYLGDLFSQSSRGVNIPTTPLDR